MINIYVCFTGCSYFFSILPWIINLKLHTKHFQCKQIYNHFIRVCPSLLVSYPTSGGLSGQRPSACRFAGPEGVGSFPVSSSSAKASSAFRLRRPLLPPVRLVGASAAPNLRRALLAPRASLSCSCSVAPCTERSSCSGISVGSVCSQVSMDASSASPAANSCCIRTAGWKSSPVPLPASSHLLRLFLAIPFVLQNRLLRLGASRAGVSAGVCVARLRLPAATHVVSLRFPAGVRDVHITRCI